MCLLNCPQGKLGCISCTGPAVWQSLFLCTPRQIQLSSSCLFTCNWTSPKSDWAALVTLTKKGRKVSKTWWGWRKLEHFTALMRRSLPTAKLTAEWWDFQMPAPSMLILQFLTETLQVRTGVNTLLDTNQDKKSPGTHPGLTLWLSSALRVAICSFPASKRDDNPLRTMANCATLPVI